MQLTLVSGSPDATRALGAALAAELRAGDVVVLSGELGAGKTCLVQGLAAALGHDGRVTSPTYLLARRLATVPPVVHADAWRLDRVADLLDLGDELLDEDVVTVLEWGDAVAAVLPHDRVEVDLVVDDTRNADDADDPHGSYGTDTPRAITVHGRGTWAARLEHRADELRAAVEGAGPGEDA